MKAAAPVSSQQLRLWLLAASQPIPEERCLDCLSAAEARHFVSIEDPMRRREFLGSRALLRRILGRELGLAPSEVPLTRNEHGKPLLGQISFAAAPPIHFNFSHSEGALLLGLDSQGPIGVDIESPREASEALMQRCLSPKESRRLKSLPPSERQREFCRVWSIKEAVLKAHGQGLSLSLRSVETEAENAAWAAGCEWWSLDPGMGLCAAVARLAAPEASQLAGPPQMLRVHDWSDESLFASS